VNPLLGSGNTFRIFDKMKWGAQYPEQNIAGGGYGKAAGLSIAEMSVPGNWFKR